MEKEQILSTINEKLSAEGIKTDGFQRTFNTYIDGNLPEEGSEPDDAYWDKHVGILKSIYGQYCHDVAQGIKGGKEKPFPKGSEGEGGDDKRYSALEEKFDKLMSAHKELSDRLAKEDSQKTQQELMSKVKAEMKKNGATDDYVLKQTLRGVTFDAKKSVADLAKEMLEVYDSEFKDCRGKGAAPRSGAGKGGSNDKPFGSFFANKKAKEGWG